MPIEQIAVRLIVAFIAALVIADILIPHQRVGRSERGRG